jgi:hypothetical protein
MSMPDTQQSPLVADYLRRLDAAAAGLPADRRSELVEGIREHLDSALEGTDQSDDAQIRAVLDRLGSPEEIVAAATDGEPPPSPQQPRSGPGALEIIAVILLPIGGIILPILGWFVGLALLWASGKWTVRDKLIGTFIWPGGYLIPLVLLMTPAEPCGPGSDQCGTMPAWLGAPVAVILFLAPLAVVGYLLTRARRSPAGAL